MGRVIEVQDPTQALFGLVLQVGDVLYFRASGGGVVNGSESIENLGVFMTAMVGDNGQVLTAMGTPNVVLFRAIGKGRASIQVFTGEPMRQVRETTLEVIVGP